MRLFSCYYEIYNKTCVITMNKINKKAKRLNFHKGRQSRNLSQTNGYANVSINS